jgi:hypothetical protein
MTKILSLLLFLVMLPPLPFVMSRHCDLTEAETIWSSISCVVDRICAAGGAVIPANPYQL